MIEIDISKDKQTAKVLKHVSAPESYFQKREKQFTLSAKELEAVAPFPKNALIELSNGCNHKCIFCKNADQARTAGQLELSVFQKFVSEAVPLGLQELGLYATGEPFMTKDIDKYISMAKEKGVRRIYITTNGALATLAKVKKCFAAGLSSIKFSINAANAVDYLAIHGYDDFDKVLKNVEQIYEWKTSNHVDIQLLGSCVLIPGLKDTEQQHKLIFSKYFEDTTYLRAGSQGGQAFQLPLSDEYKSIVFGELEKEPNTNRPCLMPWNRAHLTAEGFLTACCVDYELDLAFGDIKKNSFEKIWNNETVKYLRRKHITDQLNGLLCDQCMNNRPASFSPLMEVQKKTKSEQLRKNEQSKLLKRFIKLHKLP